MVKRGKGAMLLLARLDSSRLPGKQLKQLSPEFSVLGLLVKRLARCKTTSHMILTTTSREIDQPLIEFAATHNLDFFRGDVNNVAQRCLEAMKSFNLDWFIRICADSPLMDPEIIDLVAEDFLSNDSDLTSNVFIAHDFPFGCSVEIITREAMQRICDEAANDSYCMEHVTAFAYQNPEQFKIASIRSKEVYSEQVQAITVDTKEDLEKAIWMVEQLPNPIYADLKEIVPLAEEWQNNNSNKS